MNEKLQISIESIAVVTSVLFFVSMAILIVLAMSLKVYEYADKLGLLK